MNTFRRNFLLQLIHPFRWRLAATLCFTALVSVLGMLPPLLVRAVIDQVITRDRESLLAGLAALMILVPVLHAVCSFGQLLSVAYVGQKLVMSVRQGLFEHLLRLSMRFYGKHSVGKLVHRLMGDSTNVQQMLAVNSVQAVSDFVCATFAISVTFLLNWRLALLLVAIVVLFVINYNANIARIRRTTRSYRGAEDRLAGGVQSRLVANLTVKTFGTESREHGVFRQHSDTSLDLTRESMTASNTFSMNTILLRDVGRAIIYFAGCALVLHDTASYGDVVAFTAYAMQLLMPAVRFSSLAQQMQDAWISMDRLFELLEEQPEITERPDAAALTRAAGRVDFDHVHFHYEPDRPVLQDLDLHIEPGETVALVGPTGCGKTTILSLLLRFFDVQEGAVRLDGVNVRDMNIASLRAQFGIVLQESQLFTVSVADNIRYSRPQATPEEIAKAAKSAEIHRDIVALERGYDARVGSPSVQLSGGQKQRISIARAILAAPAILIMDEATSALDSESERAIQKALDRFLRDRTSFIVAHRLSTIRNADRIVLLGEGRIREMGNHEQLMAIPNGVYRDLYHKHLGRGVIAEE